MTEVTNKNDVAIIDFKVDENGNSSININESTNSNLTPEKIQETKGLWSTLLEIFTPEVISKPREIKILYDSKYNERLQQNLDNGLDSENAHLDAVAGTFGDFVEREGGDYFFGNIYSVDPDMPGSDIAGPIMSYSIDKLKNDVDQSNIIANAFRDFFTDNSNSGTANNSEFWVNEDGHIFLLDEERQMTIRLTDNESSSSQSFLLSSSVKEFSTKSVKITNQNGDSQTFKTSTGDNQKITDDKNLIPEGSKIIDKNGNEILSEDAITVVQNKDGNNVTIISDDIKVQDSNGNDIGFLSNIVEMGKTGIQNTINFFSVKSFWNF